VNFSFLFDNGIIYMHVGVFVLLWHLDAFSKNERQCILIWD